MHLTTFFQSRVDGTKRKYYIIRKQVWDEARRRWQVKYIGYVGKTPYISMRKARRICRRRGIHIEELKAVRGLTILP